MGPPASLPRSGYHEGLVRFSFRAFVVVAVVVVVTVVVVAVVVVVVVVVAAVQMFAFSTRWEPWIQRIKTHCKQRISNTREKI